MIKRIKNIILLIVGFNLMIFGVISLFLPFSPGLVLLFLGITVCARASSRFKNHKLVIELSAWLNLSTNKIKDKINWKKIDRLF